ncbi:MAG: LysR family transcriptional regulator [Lachnospiraceae bacterium]
MLDYRIETFVTLCKTMNYRMTAEILNITQPAVTQHIQYLEDYYGCKLFSYDKRKLSMTPEAATLLRYAYTQNYQEKKLIEELKEKEGYYFSIGTTKTIGEHVIAGTVEYFLRDKKNKLSIETDNTIRILELLNQGKIDFALIEGFFDQHMYAHRLYEVESYVGFCSREHSFAGKTVSLENLLKETVIVREMGSGTRNILERMLQANNHTIDDFERVISIGNLGLLEQLVAANAGITFAYQIAGKHNEMLAEFHVEGWNIEREFNYVFLPNTDAEKYVEIFEQARKMCMEN